MKSEKYKTGISSGLEEYDFIVIGAGTAGENSVLTHLIQKMHRTIYDEYI